MGNANNNTITLHTGASLAETSSIYGGYAGEIAPVSRTVTGDAFTNNRLVLNDFQGKVAQLGNFEFIDITTSGKDGDMLVISGGDPTDLTNTKVHVIFTGISRSANIGDKIHLIRNDAGLVTNNMALVESGQEKVRGAAYLYNLLFESDANTLHATVTDKKFNNQSKALAEGRVATMAHLNMGGDLIAEQGISQALHAGRTTDIGKFNVFAAMESTRSRIDTGSHINLYGYSALVGAGLTPSAMPSLNLGLFAESGWGHYSAFNEFEDAASVRGSGRSEYYGGGILAHYDFTKAGARGLSMEASFRAGEAETDYKTGDLPNARYDMSTPYLGGHAGVNYTRQLGSNSTWSAMVASSGRRWTEIAPRLMEVTSISAR